MISRPALGSLGGLSKGGEGSNRRLLQEKAESRTFRIMNSSMRMRCCFALVLFVSCGDDGAGGTGESGGDSGSTGEDGVSMTSTSEGESSTGEAGPMFYELTEWNCFPKCALDVDPVVFGKMVACEVAVEVGGQQTVLSECIPGQMGDAAIPDANSDICYRELVDTSGRVTPEAEDDVSDACYQWGYTLEFAFEFRSGYELPAGAVFLAACELSNAPEIDCPGLPFE